MLSAESWPTRGCLLTSPAGAATSPTWRPGTEFDLLTSWIWEAHSHSTPPRAQPISGSITSTTLRRLEDVYCRRLDYARQPPSRQATNELSAAPGLYEHLPCAPANSPDRSFGIKAPRAAHGCAPSRN